MAIVIRTGRTSFTIKDHEIKKIRDVIELCNDIETHGPDSDFITPAKRASDQLQDLLAAIRDYNPDDYKPAIQPERESRRGSIDESAAAVEADPDPTAIADAGVSPVPAKGAKS